MLIAMLAGLASAQPPAGVFDRRSSYSRSIEEMDTKYQAHQSAGERMISERKDALNRLAETQKAAGQILQTQAMASLMAAQTELVAASSQAEFSSMIAVKVPAQQFGLSTPSLQMRVAANQLNSIQVCNDIIQHKMKTLDQASKLTVERYWSQIRDLERIVNGILAWESTSISLFHQYWELADVAGVKSDLELEAALQQLDRSSVENPGAVFLKAMTLVRMEQFDDALLLLNRLQNVPAVHLIASAARAELLMRTGKQREARNELRQSTAVSLKDARAKVHRAVAYAAGGELRLAELEWEAVLKLGGHEIAARRAIALINASYATPTTRNKEKAIENANLASQLAGEEWSCEIAVALASDANGESEKAIEAAKRAAHLTLGSKHNLCVDVQDKIKDGERPIWRF